MTNPEGKLFSGMASILRLAKKKCQADADKLNYPFHRSWCKLCL